MEEGLDTLREGLPAWYRKWTSAELPSEVCKLSARLDHCGCVVGVGMVPDVNQRISSEDEAWAVACAVQHADHALHGASGPRLHKQPEVKEALLLPDEAKTMRTVTSVTTETSPNRIAILANDALNIRGADRM